MQKIRSTLIVILMIAAALAGCISEDTSDLDTQIEVRGVLADAPSEGGGHHQYHKQGGTGLLHVF